MKEITHAKITRSHVERKAIIYVRQSSQNQVQNNRESQERQYNLRHRAEMLGWHPDNCAIIDDDLGISGARSENRPGFQKIVSMVALSQVGIIFGIEVSRLARNCLDWYHLLEVSSTFGVLIGDEDGVYDPASFNDRLLLGLKGTISEVELQQIKARMHRGLMNKARKGELIKPLPIGFEVDHLGKIKLSSNEAVRHSIKIIFQLFRKIGSVSGTLKELNRRKVELPYHPHEKGLVGTIQWKPPVYSHLYSILTNECFAGIYAYGKRRVRYNPVLKRQTSTKLKQKDWEVFIPNNHDGYISVEEFEKNQKRIRGNSFVDRKALGAPREGSNILQGIVYCLRCGRKMRSDYQKEYQNYSCTQEGFQNGEGQCSWANANRVDSRVEKIFLSVLNEGTVDLTFEMMKTQKEEVTAEKKRWQQKLSRLEYQANLARRRYDAVDPDNRLVAASLEREWNQCLKELEAAKQDYAEEFDSPVIADVSASDIKQKLSKTLELWREGKISWTDKKQILRCLIERVAVSNETETVVGKIFWYGGAVSEFNYPKRLISNLDLYERVKELAVTHTDLAISKVLNAEGLRSATGKKWQATRVLSFRQSNRILSSFSISDNLRLPDSPYRSAGQAAKLLGSSARTVSMWAVIGLLETHHDGGRSKYWIRLTPENIQNLNGTLKPEPTDLALSSLVNTGEYANLKAIVGALKTRGCTFIRAKKKRGVHFYARTKKGELLNLREIGGLT